MMSVEMKRIHAVAAEMDEHLRADDLRLQHSVMILHEEGTTLFYRNAYLVKILAKVKSRRFPSICETVTRMASMVRSKETTTIDAFSDLKITM